MSRVLEVLRAGPLTTVQDRGRIGLAHLAVPRSGALDEPAWKLANRLVGNDEHAAALETTLAGPALRPRVSCHLAITGAWVPIDIDGRAAPWGIPFFVRAGQTVSIGTATRGLRAYVAVSGGFAVAPTLGSPATDLLSGLGHPPLRDGDTLPLGEPVGPPAVIASAPYPAPPTELHLRLILGPRHDWFTDDAISLLAGTTYSVTPVSNRIALRLHGTPIPRQATKELPSEGTVTGAVQVPADGHPLVFLKDHPTTVGYPIIGVVDPSDLSLCAQARPGTPVRFHLKTVPRDRRIRFPEERP
ncbi:biotin-dependent carboxyltransferase family protein [Amycolatopsis acidiphila]|uniref:Biotin-dependent carboxyltransferase family protein n=1 Tax=Amycolatopsis acidiphila TaxID=715473 RepID=A0A558AJ24_9PSEU|nr:biotin-dependent carboxyltransferase family protein [Amycolatopsis acidiphila]TVT24265.1 biotin-dependent carboxyltransferase family protein [Amycolatopsis acidiphila]UIJ62605.1 biotin-dependent carboxyltransferase family protein [Amycolatopsis acidiphila]GHG85717.1 allophanate hydrolase [Amycolatopsis acidiphila]